MNIRVENRILAQSIANCLDGKWGADVFTDQELAGIENIPLHRKMANGRDTGIGVENIFLFPNLKYVTLRYYSLTMRDLSLLQRHKKIREVSFLDCSFENVDFDKISAGIKNLKFIYCWNLPLKFPRVKNVMVSYCEMNFDSIDFSKAVSISITNSTVKNVFDLIKYSNIETVNLDGSILIQANGQTISDIRVAEGCSYTHRKRDLYPVDDLKW